MSDTVGQEALARLEELLAPHEHLKVVREPKRVVVEGSADGGFDVEIVDDGDEATIFASGWHNHYYEPETAAATFMWLLTSWTRIVLHYRGKNQVGWELQRCEPTGWTSCNRGATLVSALMWGKKRLEIFQNNLIECDRPD